MKYRTIVVDPPWKYRKGEWTNPDKGRNYAEDYYSTLTMAEIAALPIGELADVDAHLYLWVTCPRLYHDRNDEGLTPFDIARSWGFDYRTLLTWVKGSRVGMGAYWRVDTEHVLFCIRGAAPIEPSKRLSNVFNGMRGRHSEKPAGFYDLVGKCHLRHVLTYSHDSSGSGGIRGVTNASVWRYDPLPPLADSGSAYGRAFACGLQALR